MSNGLPGNPHEGYAIEHESQAYATLALAYEERTRALIALARYTAEVGRSELAAPLIDEIRRRLGLDGDNE